MVYEADKDKWKEFLISDQQDKDMDAIKKTAEQLAVETEAVTRNVEPVRFGDWEKNGIAYDF